MIKLLIADVDGTLVTPDKATAPKAPAAPAPAQKSIFDFGK